MLTRTAPRRRTARGFAAGLALLCLGALLQGGGAAVAAEAAGPGRAAPASTMVTGADTAVEADPAVAAARAARERAEADLSALTAALDKAAGAYERANAHALRLQNELTEADQQVAATERVVARAEENFTDRVVGSYKRPAVNIELAQAVLAADEPGTAMHRVALLQQLNLRGADRLADVREVGARTTEAVQQHHVVLAGSAGAAASADHTAAALTTLVEEARAQVESTRQEASAAEEAVRARVAEEARRAADDAAAADAARAAGAFGAFALIGPGQAGSAAALLGTAGPVYCPIAGPSGFIDSWGFPRSGGRSHQGTDMFAAYGTPLVAATDGTVQRVWNNALGGLSVNLVTPQGDRFYYAHLSAASVRAGQQLAAGEVLGAVGDSGNARGTPPHLHWQFHPGGGAPVNPYALAVALCR